MKKQEIIHVHSLVSQAQDFLIENGEIEKPDDSRYDDDGIVPTAIHRRKPEHKLSLFLLLDEINQNKTKTEQADPLETEDAETPLIE